MFVYLCVPTVNRLSKQRDFSVAVIEPAGKSQSVLSNWYINMGNKMRTDHPESPLTHWSQEHEIYSSIHWKCFILHSFSLFGVLVMSHVLQLCLTMYHMHAVLLNLTCQAGHGTYHHKLVAVLSTWLRLCLVKTANPFKLPYGCIAHIIK